MKPLYLGISLAVVMSGCNKVEQSSSILTSVDSTVTDFSAPKGGNDRKIINSKPTATTAQHKVPPAENIVADEKPLIGYYEVRMSFANSTGPGFTDEFTSFKWVRLFKNGTYTTSQSKKGRIEGCWSYNPTINKIIFRNRYMKSEGHEIWDYLEGDCWRQGNLHIIYWGIDSEAKTGSVYLVWKEP